ncbi:release factor glutamine methyltransferase [Tistlia consotensis]|uniref:Release factor glutamine methyltransferase n=1 Tax=Tistlia consotensis USBA 355 TaxID=560819 RepID=A0A1Y6C4J8_9PROT|nr:peptide chain release factor N(5)-glutamine methyltransferase [Tistlia consotensis]SMF33742.1 release factor glutamine methyltransferase [Tistlia consotensis USBA 355]SNR70276.1 release factor glutamine methyltransferase [Tistlia consotensis]
MTSAGTAVSRAEPGPAISLGAALATATAELAAAGVEGARRDARLLLADAAGLEPAAVVAWPERPLAGPARATFESHVRRRAAHEPVSRILGRREFWSLSFALSPATLDPRPDSETLVEALLAEVGDRQRPLRLLDLGTGSGCLLLALLSELPAAWGLGIDRAPAAAAAARRNAAALGLGDRAAFLAGDWAAALDGRFDLIVSNPPYIARDELAGLDPEVARHDPPAALDGGPDGLDAYRALAAALPRLLRPGGVAALEIGSGQAASAGAVLTAGGLPAPRLLSDLAGRPRGLLFHASSAGTPL